jgi:anti-sigma factor (TIGR02949 family)
MSEKFLTCKEAIRMLVEYLDNELDRDRSGALEHHLDACRSCKSRHEFEKGLRDRVSALGQAPVRPEFQDRIRALVSRFENDSGDL